MLSIKCNLFFMMCVIFFIFYLFGLYNYKAEKYLGKVIQSILNEIYKDFKFIVINDGLSNISLQIIVKYTNQDERNSVNEQRK